jgi:hypothetical protein
MRLPSFKKWRRAEETALDRAIGISRRLVTRAGEADGTKVAASLATTLGALPDEGMILFFRWLVLELGPPQEDLLLAAASYVSDPCITNAAQ